MKYLQERRRGAGRLPAAAPQPRQRVAGRAGAERLRRQLEGTEEREISTTMAFVRILGMLVRDKNIGKQVVPIVPDESRTFGMEGMFRQLGIYSQVGQLYKPEDADQLMYYREDQTGRSCRRASTRPARCPRGSPRPPRTHHDSR